VKLEALRAELEALESRAVAVVCEQCISARDAKSAGLIRRLLLPRKRGSAYVHARCGQELCIAPSHLYRSGSRVSDERMLRMRVEELQHDVACETKEAERQLHWLRMYRRGKPATSCIEIADKGVRKYILRRSVSGRPLGAYLCHRCDNPRCVRLDHLFWGTASDNMRDCLLKGRRPGSKYGDLEARVSAAETKLMEWQGLLARVDAFLALVYRSP